MPVRAPVIFLDIDGVMLPTRAYALAENVAEVKAVGSISAVRPDRARLHPDAVASLNEIHRQISDARLVLCTSWRHSVGVAETIACLERNGVASVFWHADPACPWTPPTAEVAELGATTGSNKADDIVAWLDQHAATVNGWVAIDDDAELTIALKATPVPGAVVQIDGELGLTEADVPAVLSALAGNSR